MSDPNADQSPKPMSHWLTKADELLTELGHMRARLGGLSQEERGRALHEHCAAWLMRNFDGPT